MPAYSIGSRYTGPIHDEEYRPIGWVEGARVERSVVAGCFQHLALERARHATVRIAPDPEPLQIGENTITAISVVPRRHLATRTYVSMGGTTQAALYGAQVNLRSVSPDEGDVYMVVRRYEGTQERWFPATPEMSRDEYDRWNGTQTFAKGGTIHLDRRLERWLDRVVTMDPELFRDPGIFPWLNHVPAVY